MSNFTFYPELFGERSEVVDLLDNAGINQFEHYDSADCMHDVYGIEVGGVYKKEIAKKVFDIMAKRYPQWYRESVYVKDNGPDQGWRVSFFRDKRIPRERWG